MTHQMHLTKKLIFPILALLAALVALAIFLNKALSVGKARPQDPSMPLPYYAERVVFPNNRDGITLAGTLTLPTKEGVYPTVVLISGSGPQNRDEEIAGHRPFLVLADHLTRSGIAVLRYDDRGTGKSTGKFRMSQFDEFASDAKSAIAYLKTRKEVDQHNIGLIGHSEGGLVAPLVATSCDDVAFIVLLAGPGTKLKDLLPLQQKLIAISEGATEAEGEYIRKGSSDIIEMLRMSASNAVFRAKLTEYTKANWDSIKGMPLIPEDMSREQYISKVSERMTTRWLRDFIDYDPVPVLEKVRCPVLAINGTKDVQVAARENLAGIRNALARGGNRNVTIRELPELNHLFQECKTGAREEYSKIQQTFSPKAMEEISEWVLKQVEARRSAEGG